MLDKIGTDLSKGAKVCARNALQKNPEFDTGLATEPVVSHEKIHHVFDKKKSAIGVRIMRKVLSRVVFSI